MMRNNHKEGFTLAELLIVVAIIGILVAVSIPIFTAQLDKTRIAVNKANIRAAKAAASEQFYSDIASGSLGGNAFGYYYYDTKTGKLNPEESIYGTDSDRGNKINQGNAKGKACRDSVKDGEVYEYIMVYVSEEDKQGGASIQTAPYYDDNNKIGNVSGGNPYGPYAGK